MQEIAKVPAKVAMDIEFVCAEDAVMTVAYKLEDAVRRVLADSFVEFVLAEPRIAVVTNVHAQLET